MDAYARGELTEGESQDFEQALLTDDALAREYRWFRAAEAGYTRLRRRELFAEIHREVTGLDDSPAAETPVHPLWPRWARPLAAAASVAGVLVLGWWVLRDSRPTPPVAVSSKKTPDPKPVSPRPKPAPSLPRSAPEAWQAYMRQTPKGIGDTPTGLEAVARALNAGQARAALRRLNAAEAAAPEPLLGSGRDTLGRQPARPVAAPDPSFRNLYRAVCYLQLNQPDKALAYLNQVHDPDIRPTAEWYGILARWQRGQRAEARQRLKRIARQPSHPYRREAETLLAQLPEF